MDWIIRAKNRVKCSDCGGSGYLPYDGDDSDQTDHLTVELLCSKCEGMGKIIENVDLSLEALKDLLK